MRLPDSPETARICFMIRNKGYYTAGQALHPPPMAAFRGKPRGIKPFVSSLARSCPCKHGRDLALFVNKIDLLNGDDNNLN
jgi:hypothetical protein